MKIAAENPTTTITTSRQSNIQNKQPTKEADHRTIITGLSNSYNYVIGVVEEE